MENLSVGSISAGIISSIIFFILGVIINRVYASIVTWPYRRVWSQVIGGGREINVVLSTRKGPYTRSTPRVSINEVDAYVSLANLARLIHRKIHYFPSSVSLDSLSDRHIVLLGGPLSNEVTDQLWDTVCQRIPYEIDRKIQSITSGTKQFHPSLDSEGFLTEDFGIIAKIRIPGEVERFLLMSAGCHGFATRAGVDFLSNPTKLRNLESRVGRNEFVAIVRVTTQKGAEVSSQLAECLSLT